jgi:hypothetical protein
MHAARNGGSTEDPSKDEERGSGDHPGGRLGHPHQRCQLEESREDMGMNQNAFHGGGEIEVSKRCFAE